MKTILIAFAMIGMISTAQAAKSKKLSAKSTAAACAQETVTANCTTEKVGVGLARCLHNYKKVYNDFEFSPACQTAMKKLATETKAVR